MIIDIILCSVINEHQSNYAKVDGSVSVDALQRKEAEESACGKVHDPVFKITKIYFQEKLLCNFLVKNEKKRRSFRLDFGNVNALFRRNIHGVTRRSLMQREFHIRNLVLRREYFIINSCCMVCDVTS